MKILIDPGHGKNDNKGVYPEYKEGTQMWKLAQYVIDLLKKYECEVKCTRPSIDDNPTVEERGRMAEGYDIFLSLHSNTPGSDSKGTPAYEKCTGTISFYSIKRPDDKQFATDLAKDVGNVMGIYSRGAKTKTKKNGDDYYGVIRNAIEVGCKHAYIIEHGFHTNKHDCEFLLNDDNLKKIAQCEVDLMTKYYSIPLTPIEDNSIKAGDIVKINNGAVYTNGKTVPSSYLKYEWIVNEVKQTRCLLGKSTDGKHSLMSWIEEKYLTKVVSESTAQTYPILSINTNSLLVAMTSIGLNNNYLTRYKLAKANSMPLYIGTATQNQRLLKLLQEGECKKI